MSDTTLGDDPAVPSKASESVTRLLDQALESAREAGMSTSELIGLFFYYAHAIAASYRERVIEAGERPQPDS